MQSSYFAKSSFESDCTLSADSKRPQARLIRLHFSARDLPEPDTRSRASYAVIYHATEFQSSPSHSTSLQQPPHVSVLTDASIDSTSSSSTPHKISTTPNTPSSSVVPDAHLLRQASLAVKNPHKSSALRAPHIASSYTAPGSPISFLAADGTPVTRTAWTKLGTTEVARKNGRDVEFATSFLFQFNYRQNQLIRLVFYDCTSNDIEKQRLIGTAEFPAVKVYSAKGRPVTFPLTFMPVTKKDVKRSARIPVGALVVTAERVTGEFTKYHVDVECNRILRTKALSNAPVKRVFYAIHGILDSDPGSDHWTLLYRSDPVEMIHKKRDGGSLEYNYFSSRRLIAGPGLIIDNPDARKTDNTMGVGGMMSKALGIKRREQFFSLPGAHLLLSSEHVRLKMTLFEDGGLVSGFFFIANTEFTIADLKRRKLGDSSAVKVHSNVVGKAMLKYVECAGDPRYFCLSLELQNLRYIHSALSIQIAVDPLTRKCFTEQVPRGATIYAEFRASSSGYPVDLTLVITNEHGHIVSEKSQMTHDKITIVPAAQHNSNYYAQQSPLETYRFCLIPHAARNHIHSSGKTRVSFSMKIGGGGVGAKKVDLLKSSRVEQTNQKIRQLDDAVNRVLFGLDTLRKQEDILTQENSAMSRHVVTVSLLTSILVVSIGVFQFDAVKEMLRKRKMIP